MSSTNVLTSVTDFWNSSYKFSSYIRKWAGSWDVMLSILLLEEDCLMLFLKDFFFFFNSCKAFNKFHILVRTSGSLAYLCTFRSCESVCLWNCNTRYCRRETGKIYIKSPCGNLPFGIVLRKWFLANTYVATRNRAIDYLWVMGNFLFCFCIIGKIR